MTSAPTVLTWKDAITLSVAVLGAALGIMNTWNTISQRRVRLRVRPSLAFAVPNGGAAVSIEAVNLSTFPVTVEEVGFAPAGARGKRPRRLVVMEPIFVDQKPWPRRLEPREAVTAYVSPDYLAGAAEMLGKAYVRTSCGEIAFGVTPALRQIRRELGA